MDIWVKELPRERPVRVTTHQAADSYPVWSPDGRHLAFISKRRDAQGDIWLVALDLKKGGAPKDKPIQLTHYLGLDQKPSFSPDGKRIVFMSDRNGEPNLWILDVGSGGAIQLTSSGGTDPAWSPTETGWPLFFSGYSPKYGKGGGYWYVPDGDAGPVYFSYASWGPVWSAGGTWVAFGHIRGSKPLIWTEVYIYETEYNLFTPLTEP